MRVALYLRVSTRDGRQDAENQRLHLRQFAEAQAWEIVREYEDHDTGGRSDRTEFQAMLQDAAARKFDLLMFWALDRFSREGTLATLKYLELLESYCVRWRSFTEPWIDSAGPFRDVVISLIATLAKQERMRLSERVKAGLDRARTKGTRTGRPIGRPRRVFRRDEVLRLRDEEGLSWPEIARRMGVSQGTVVRAYRSLSGSTVPFQNLVA